MHVENRMAREQHLWAHLRPGEVPLAFGATSFMGAILPAQLPSGTFRTSLAVTTQRLLWSDGDRVGSLDLGSITGWREGTQGHRYAIRLEHPPLERLEWYPGARFLWFRVGAGTRLRRVSVSTFAFSRRDTVAAVVLRAKLEQAGIAAGDPLAIAQPSRAERIGGGRAVLAARR